MTGHCRMRPVVARKRVGRPVEPQQRVTSVDERANMGRIFRKHVIIARERFIDAAKFETGVGEIVEDFRMVRCKQQGVAIARDRFLKASRRVKREPKVRHRIRGSGIDLERLRQEAQRIDKATALQAENAEQLECIEIVGPVFQNSGTQPLSLVEMALLKRIIGLPLHARQVRHRGIFPLRRQRASPGSTDRFEKA